MLIQNDKQIGNILIKTAKIGNKQKYVKKKYTLKALKISNTCLVIYDILTCRSKTSVYVTYKIKQKLAESDDTSSD